jgi:hypothetical protein
MFNTKVRVSQIHPTRYNGAMVTVLSGWMTLADAQDKMGEWSYYTPASDMLIIRDRFGRQQGLGLMGKTHDLWS